MIGLESDEQRIERLARASFEGYARRMEEREERSNLDSFSPGNAGSPGLGRLDFSDRGGLGPRDRGFSSFGEQMKCISDASTPGRAADARLFRGLEERAASGLSEGVSTEGGFLVETQFSDRLLRMALESSQLARRCTPMPIPKNANGIRLPYVPNTDRRTGSRFGGLQLFWLGEAEQKTGTKPSFAYVELQLKKLAGLCYVTDELLEDSSVLGPFLERAFRSEFAFVLDDAIIRGTGVGQPLGILNSPATVTVAKEAGQTAATINATNISKMYSRLPSSSLATAVCSSTAIPPCN